MVDKEASEAAAILGRLGGRVKVPKGISALNTEERKQIAMKGVEARRKKAAARKKAAKKK